MERGEREKKKWRGVNHGGNEAQGRNQKGKPRRLSGSNVGPSQRSRIISALGKGKGKGKSKGNIFCCISVYQAFWRSDM